MTSTHSQTTPLPALTTEVINAALTNIDLLDTETRLRLMNAEDALVAAAVEREIPQIARAVQRVAASFRAGGRLLYIGAGTSGRLGVLDAVECPPTFGVSPQLVQGLIAGGPGAMFQAVEGAEDDPELGAAAIIGAEVGERDTVVGISASGQAPFVLGALRQAVKRGAATVALTNNRLTEMEKIAALTIAPIVGPEILAGSTRLKSGTAQKMVLNMISTGAMIEIGKTYGNLMVDVQTTNRKLQARAIRIVCQVTGTTPERAEAALSSAGGSAKIAIVLLQTGVTLDEAKQRLAHAGGFLRRALAEERD
jgi:N-acetylmuramic acid 6-phosphate etherase